MHSSAMRIGTKFLENYSFPALKRILEIGSLDVNGSLRSSKPRGVEWIGVDIESGKGVDVVIEPHKKLPFPDNHFDLVVASSIFEHDVAFWKTMSEMARVVSDEGYIYVSAPSNGPFHRYPLDIYRFYPDAGQALVEIARESGKPEAFLSESFVGHQDSEGMWNDFVAVIGASPRSPEPYQRIFQSENSANIWSGEKFLVETFDEDPEDRKLAIRVRGLEKEIQLIRSSWSWRLTAPIRFILKFAIANRKPERDTP